MLVFPKNTVKMVKLQFGLHIAKALQLYYNISKNDPRRTFYDISLLP